MTNNDRQTSATRKAFGLSDFGIGVLSEPTFTPKPNRVEIWRYSKSTLTVARSSGDSWNGPDIGFDGRQQHDGIWDGKHLKFVPKPSNHFSDGTPVDLYEGQREVEDE